MSEAFTPANDLERALVEAHAGRLEPEDFIGRLMASEVFMPVYESASGQFGIQASDKARPLMLEADDGQRALVLFTSPERAKPFLKDFPDYNGGLVTEFTWILERTGVGFAILLNPGTEVELALDMAGLAGEA